jgi:ABC-type multidrug transport system permease subunit
LPKTGAAPIRNEELPWSLIILGGFSAIALVYGARKYRRSHPSKR